MQEAAVVVVVWFAADTKAPISLLELGLVARQRQGGTSAGAGAGAGAGATVGGEGKRKAQRRWGGVRRL
ncbi:Nucleoside 2-deoxyribosyltransferase like [Microdochium nivale]|nr:Nucleoside 2-deoxyribosyltransferase like [Microdochium nivale]